MDNRFDQTSKISNFLSEIRSIPQFSPSQDDYEPQFAYENSGYSTGYHEEKEVNGRIAEFLPNPFEGFHLLDRPDSDEENSHETPPNYEEISCPNYAQCITPIGFSTTSGILDDPPQTPLLPPIGFSTNLEILDYSPQTPLLQPTPKQPATRSSVCLPPYGEFVFVNNDNGCEGPSTSASLPKPLSSLPNIPSTSNTYSEPGKKEKKKRGRKPIYVGNRNEKNKQSRDRSRQELRQIHQQIEQYSTQLSSYLWWIENVKNRFNQPFEMFRTIPEDSTTSEEVFQIVNEIKNLAIKLGERHRKNGNRRKGSKNHEAIGKISKK